jgi:ribonuclease P protein component
VASSLLLLSETKSLQVKSLKKNSDFLELKKIGRKLRPVDWLIVSFVSTEQREVLVGTTVSRKVGSAVIRNKIKRWCREIFRQHPPLNDERGYKINVVLKPVDKKFYKQLFFAEFERQLLVCIKKIKLDRAK